MCKYNLDLLIKRLLSSWWLHGNKLQVSCIRCPLPNYKRAHLLTDIKVILYTDFIFFFLKNTSGVVTQSGVQILILLTLN